jgi:acetyl esterase/lipase
MRIWVLALLTLVLGGCQAVAFKTLNAVSSTDGVKRVASELYAPELGLQLDVYRGDSAPPNAPVIVFFYGGSWQNGDRGWYQFAGEALAARGYVVVVPDYRTYPNVKFPRFVEDSALAVRYVETRAAAWGGDPKKLFLSGHSAGAHIALLLALDAHYLKDAGADPARLRGVVGLAGPYDFLPLKDNTLKELFGDDASQRRAQPIEFARVGAPPLLLIHGTDDSIVEPGNSERLALKQMGLNSPVELKLLEDFGHMGLILDLRKTTKSIVLDDIDRFIGERMR